MKEQIWTNKRDWLTIVYPYIIEWATKLDYSIPSISVLDAYVVKFLDCESYSSTYNGDKIQAVGTHYGSLKRIKIAAKRNPIDVIGTLIHEFAHAVQLFSLGEKFHMQYSAESEKHAHEENKFEDEARLLTTKLRHARIRNTILREELDEFVYSFEKEKPKPKPVVKKEKPYGRTFGGWYEPRYRRTTEWYKPYSKDWWNY